MFDYKYYNELLELVRLDRKAEEYRIKAEKYRLGDTITFNRKYKKHLEREMRKYELRMKHVDYYYYYINEVYGKNRMKKIYELSQIIEVDKMKEIEDQSEKYYNNPSRRTKRIILKP